MNSALPRGVYTAMTVFDGIVVALLEGLWTILVRGVFLAPGRAVSRFLWANQEGPWSGFWRFYASTLFWSMAIYWLL